MLAWDALLTSMADGPPPAAASEPAELAEAKA